MSINFVTPANESPQCRIYIVDAQSSEKQLISFEMGF